MKSIIKNNTGYAEWSVEPQDSAVSGAPAQRYLNRTGRVEIVIEPLEESYWDRDAEESNTRTVFPVNVYESTHFDYGHDEYIDYSLVATVRPSTNGTGFAQSFPMAQTLAINALLALENENKWLSAPLNAPENEFVSPSLSEEDAYALYRELVVEESGGMEPTERTDALELAREVGWNDLEEYIYSLDEEEFYWELVEEPQTA